MAFTAARLVVGLLLLGAANGLVRAVGNQASEIQRSLGIPPKNAKPSLSDEEVTAIARTSGRSTTGSTTAS